MTTDSAHRGVRLERIGNSKYVVTNDRGGQIRIGRGEGTDFTPVDLLLTAIGGCTAVDVDILTSRRAEPEKFEILVDAEKVRDETGNHLTDIVVTFRIKFPEGEDGDKARELLPDAVRPFPAWNLANLGLWTAAGAVFAVWRFRWHAS